MQIRDSPVKEDRCGVCGGDGSKCKVKGRTFDRKINKIGNSRIMILPNGARNIHVSLSSFRVCIVYQLSLFVLLKCNSKHNFFEVPHINVFL